MLSERDGGETILQYCKYGESGRRKKRNLQEGDVILLNDSNVKCNEWPSGLIVKTIPSSDNRVRKVEVKIIKE